MLFSIIIPIGELLSRDRLAAGVLRGLAELDVRFGGCVRGEHPRKHLIQFNESNLSDGIALLHQYGIEAVAA